MTGLSFNIDIRLFFRESDVEEMKNIADFDLSSVEDVRAHAEEIYSRVSDGSMPCDGEWPADQVAKFKQWMDEGMEA